MIAVNNAISHLSKIPPHLLEKYGIPASDVAGFDPSSNSGVAGNMQQTGGSSSTSSEQASGNQGPKIGTIDYSNTNQNFSASQLPGVSDPDKTMADVATGQYERYISGYRDFEEALIKARNDTSLIDAAREDAPEQARIASEAAARNRSRFGLTQTAVQARETQRAEQRGAATNLAGGLNNARLAQRDANKRLLGDLINIGQGVNRSSLSQLGAAGENAVARKNAYQNAKAQHKAQTWQMVGSAGAMLAAAFLI